MRRLTPATLTSVSMRPNSFIAAPTIASIAFASDTSQTRARTVPPGGQISFAVFSSVSFSRPVTITAAPRRAKPSARPRPIPRLAPDTSTTWSFTEKRPSLMRANGTRGPGREKIESRAQNQIRCPRGSVTAKDGEPRQAVRLRNRGDRLPGASARGAASRARPCGPGPGPSGVRAQTASRLRTRDRRCPGSRHVRGAHPAGGRVRPPGGRLPPLPVQGRGIRVDRSGLDRPGGPGGPERRGGPLRLRQRRPAGAGDEGLRPRAGGRRSPGKGQRTRGLDPAPVVRAGARPSLALPPFAVLRRRLALPFEPGVGAPARTPPASHDGPRPGALGRKRPARRGGPGRSRPPGGGPRRLGYFPKALPLGSPPDSTNATRSRISSLASVTRRPVGIGESSDGFRAAIRSLGRILTSLGRRRLVTTCTAAASSLTTSPVTT